MQYMLVKKYMIILISLFAILINGIKAQNLDFYNSENQIYIGDRYITDSEGNVRMWVNIWGQVNNPGNYLVKDGIDIITLLSIAGGIKEGANLKNINIFREFPEENGKQVFTFNMYHFLKTGDRTSFPSILPNDAFFVPQKISSFLLSRVGIANTLMTAINLYYLTMIRSEQTKN